MWKSLERVIDLIFPILKSRALGTKGYIVVHSSSPGTDYPDGSPAVGGDNESLAPKAVIEWLSGKSNGYKKEGSEKVEAYWSTGSNGNDRYFL